MQARKQVLLVTVTFSTTLIGVACKKTSEEQASNTLGNGPISAYASAESQATFQIRDGGFGPACNLRQLDERGLPTNCKSTHVCTGALISDTRLHSTPFGLTAAHCSADGENAFVFFPSQKKSIPIQKFLPHPKYSEGNFWFVDHLDHLLGVAPAPANKLNVDIAVLMFDPALTKDLRTTRIAQQMPTLPHLSSEVREKQFKDVGNSRQGIVQTHLGFSLRTYDTFPKITVLGFGIENLVWSSQIWRVNYPKDICEMFSQNNGGVKYSWTDKGGCSASSEKQIAVQGTGPQGNLRENHGRLAALSESLATAVFVPPSNQPKNSPCLGDSGGPLVVEGIPGVLAVVNGGPGLCAGTLSSYTLVTPHLNTLKKLIQGG